MRKSVVCGKIFDKYVLIERKYIDLPKQYGRTGDIRQELLKCAGICRRDRAWKNIQCLHWYQIREENVGLRQQKRSR